MISDGHGAELLGGGEILLELCRRHKQEVGNVVKTAARIVRGQQKIEIDVFERSSRPRRSRIAFLYRCASADETAAACRARD